MSNKIVGIIGVFATLFLSSFSISDTKTLEGKWVLSGADCHDPEMRIVKTQRIEAVGDDEQRLQDNSVTVFLKDDVEKTFIQNEEGKFVEQK
jgi:hypothetical protein